VNHGSIVSARVSGSLRHDGGGSVGRTPRQRNLESAAAALAMSALLAAGCAIVPPATPGAPPTDAAGIPPTLAARCTQMYAALDRAVASGQVSDAMAARVEGFPYLRVDRFLASFRAEPLAGAAFDQWVEAMAAMDRAARGIEFANLPAAAPRALRTELAAQGLAEAVPSWLLEGCAAALRERDLVDDAARARLREAASVPDDYVEWMRIVGLYPVTAAGFAIGARWYEADTRAAFAVPVDQIPVRGMLRAYRPRVDRLLSRAEVAAILGQASANPLRIPDPSPADQDALFATFAPVFIVDEHDGNDRIGRPVWGADGLPGVDTEAPVIFTRVAQARVGRDALLQLVYSAWFPARTPAGPADIFAGRLDGIIWRVTLAADGTPLLFDSIHSCGCYHWFFPTPRLTALAPTPTIDEDALIPQQLPRIDATARVALRVESGSHYIRRVLVDAPLPAHGVAFAFAPDDSLRTLPLPGGGTKNLFGPDGIVPGTSRGERFLLWPLGVLDPGAMRQWGRHATAFIGRRHFDEPFLIERYFVVAPD
jgi:hypothetical protein